MSRKEHADGDRYAYAKARSVEKLPPPRSQPTPEPPADEVRHSIRCTVRLPDRAQTIPAK